MKTVRSMAALLFLAAGVCPSRAAEPPVVTINLDAKGEGPQVSPTMHGIFFEDINYAADGGLYAELVENRSFEHRDGMHAWRVESRDDAEGKAGLASEQPLHPNNPRYLRLEILRPGGGFGVSNLGYGGIPVTAGAEYRFSVHARAAAGYAGRLLARLEDGEGRVLAEGGVEKLSDRFERRTLMLTSTGTTAKARLVVLADAPGVVDLDMISLFPKNTWKQRENGLRADLVQLLADMKPGFMRFPGGCIVEGKDLGNAYRWKDTVGDISTRKQNWNRWQEVMADEKSSQYSQTYGLGFFEFFQLCEDIGAEPVPVLNCGMSCQYQDAQLVPLDGLDPWVKDALDLVEFANGPVDSKWGKLRVEMGHPAPFNLKILGVGNEQWGETYFERYAVFQKALKERYPDLRIVSTSGPGVDDGNWNLAWGKFKGGIHADIVDEHYYRPPAWFLQNEARYDRQDRSGPRVFAGEFAAHRRDRKSALDAAIHEAAFMTGLLRNADLVVMSSYAPLFARAGFTQWTPDLIFFDETRAMPTPSYHVQAMFGRNRPGRILPMQVEGNTASAPTGGRVGVGTWATQAEFKDVVVRKGDQVLYNSAETGEKGWNYESGKWTVAAGVLAQSAGDEPAVALVGDPAWKDYTLLLKARKTGGNEGFLILFEAAGGDEKGWWNIGGWGNTEHALEIAGINTPHVPGKIETGRWYDIRVEVAGPDVRCFLDNVEVHHVKRPGQQRIYTVAGISPDSSEIIVHASNPGDAAVELVVATRGWNVAGPATGSVLTSASRNDVNTLAAPGVVAPKPAEPRVEKDTVRCALPPWSHTVLRIPGKVRKLF